MIFVTVGLHKQGFDRLVKWADEVAAKIDEKVVIQRGYTIYLPKHAESFQFKESIEELYGMADMIVTHGGVGSIMTALVHGKPVIAVPRLSRYGEHKNDHQLDIVNHFSNLGLILIANDVCELEKAIHTIKNGTAKWSHYRFGSERKKLMKFLKLYLQTFMKKSTA